MEGLIGQRASSFRRIFRPLNHVANLLVGHDAIDAIGRKHKKSIPTVLYLPRNLVLKNGLMRGTIHKVVDVICCGGEKQLKYKFFFLFSVLESRVPHMGGLSPYWRTTLTLIFLTSGTALTPYRFNSRSPMLRVMASRPLTIPRPTSSNTTFP